MSDTTIYTIEATHISKLGPLPAVMSSSQNVEGREQLDTVIEWLTERGFEKNGKYRRYTWSVYHGGSAKNAIAHFNGQLTEFPPADEMETEKLHNAAEPA